MKNLIKNYSWFMVILFVLGLNACKEEPVVNQKEILPPVLTDFTPKTGEIGTEVTISGENLHQVDTVMFGSGVAELKYRINKNTIIVVVTSASRSGKVVLKNKKGISESADNFDVVFVTPSVSEYPIDGIVTKDIVLEGKNLHVVDSILLGGTKTTIISQRKNEIVFKVPFIDTEDPVALQLFYFNGTENTTTGTDGEKFTVLKEIPVIDEIPALLEKYTQATITGENLALIDLLFFDDVELKIIGKTATEIIFDLPTNYFDGPKTGVLKGIYYGVKEIIIEDAFQIMSDVNEKRYYQWNNVLLSARVPVNSNGTEDAFFDAETGTVFHSCDAHSNRMSIDFYLYDQIGYVQLYGPHNGTSTVKNYKCDNKSIVSEDLVWADFHGINTRFKVLSKDSVNHLPLINAYEAGTIIEINDELFEGISLPGTSSPRIYKSTGDAGHDSSQQHMAVNGNNLAWVRNYTTGKDGIIEILDLPKEAHTNGRIAELTFNIIWQK